MTEAPPLTQTPETGSAFARYLLLIRAADGLTLAQVCSLTSLEPTTIQNWIKRGFVPHPVSKKYRERHIARIMLIASLRECMLIERVGALMTYINGNADDEADDIISDVALYDVFCRGVADVEGCEPTREAIGERADKILDGHGLSSPDKERLKQALVVMATACIAARFKKEADRLYMDIFKEENHE